MTHEILIVVLAALALLIDIVMSRLLTPKVRIAGQRSSLYRDEHHELDEYRRKGEAQGPQSSTEHKAGGEEVHSETDSSQNAGIPRTEPATQTAHDACPGVRVYQFAFQNDEAKELSWGGKAAIIQIVIRGSGSFWQLSCRRHMTDPSRYYRMLRGFLGPDEFPAHFTKDNKRIIIHAPILRPHKTWVYRCFVTDTVDEVAFEIRLPTRLPARRAVESISRNLFWYPGSHRDVKRIVVREKEDRELTIGYRKERLEQGLRLIVLPVGAVVLYGTAVPWVAENLFGRIIVLPKWEWFAPVPILAAAVGILYRTARRESLPIAQGYQVGTWVPVKHPPVRTTESHGEEDSLA